MRFLLTFILSIVSFISLWSQTNTTEVDSLYREDQFYIGVNYSALGNQPTAVSQNGFSGGLLLGVIRDMPINKKRTVALGLGLGYATNTYRQNLFFQEDGLILETLEDNQFNNNRFTLHNIEIPFEIRWRTSTPTSYRFWRIYSGVKLSYIFASKIRTESDLGDFKFNAIEGLNELQYGLTLTTGYNNWNVSFYYGLNTLFDDSVRLNGNEVDINLINIGLTFFIL